MADQHSTLQAYISKILDLKDGISERNVLSREELKNVALEMGLSEAQWQQLLDEFEDHVTRGIGHAKFYNWDDSIQELEKALEIDPFSLKASMQLARSYAERWKKKGNENDKEKSLHFANQCLLQQPDYEDALLLISSLKMGSAPLPPDSRQSGNPMLIGGALFLLVLIFAAFAFFLTGEKQQKEGGKEVVEEKIKTENTFENSLGVPVHFIQNEKSQNLTLKPQSSETSDYQESFSYKFRGYLEIDQMEVSEVELAFELIDDQNKVLFSKVTDALSDHQPTHLDGDQIGVGMDLFEKVALPKNLKHINVRVNKIVAVPGQEIDHQYPSVEIVWPQGQPTNVSLNITERLAKESKHITSGTFQKLNWEVQNNGKVSLKSLKAEIVWYNIDSQELGRKDTWLLSSSDPVLNTGQSILAGGTYAMKEINPGQAKGYKIFLTEIDY
ncbi:MAG: hypothetical protein KDE26_14205 [Bacteroidetes bacterium]|nr:hypothetical protein [Bacteroidota bacterium]MCB0844402.1 hypothetical protein [Bacteroidota bacterium]